MHLKRSLLLACATLALGAGGSLGRAADAPAPAFSLAGAVAPAAPRQDPSAGTAPAGAEAPFVVAAPKPAPPHPGEAAAGPAGGIDLSALHYFAAHNDLGRVAAEIRLLRAGHPDWEPPPDLFSDPGGGVDEQPLWALFAEHDLGALRDGIAALRRDKPGWQPSADLAGKLALAEAHDALVTASDAKDWSAVIGAAAAHPGLLTCGDVDALWRTAEALVRTGDEARAVAAYRYVLATCTSPDLRLATVQKASLLLTSSDDLDGLVGMGRRAPDGTGEFEGVRLDLLRRRIGEAAAGTGAAQQPDPRDVEALAARAARPGGAADAQLLGWYARSRKDPASAERWFKTALDAGPDAKAAEGLVLAQGDAGHGEDARRTAIRYADLGPANLTLLVNVEAAELANPKAPPLRSDDLAALAKAVDRTMSSDGAQAIAWHLYKSGDVAGSEGWFRKSMEWTANESAAVGLVVAAQRLRHQRDYAARIAQYRDVYPQIAELETVSASRPAPRRLARASASIEPTAEHPVRVASHRRGRAAAPGTGWDASADAIVKAYNGGQYEAAVTLLEQRRRTHAEPRGLAVIRGWALYQKGDWEGAKQVFSDLDGGAFSQERQEGLRVIREAYTPPRMR